MNNAPSLCLGRATFGAMGWKFGFDSRPARHRVGADGF